MSQRLQQFLTVSGSLLFLVGGVRFYRVVRGHAEDARFAPHLLVALLSLWIASSILRIGLKKKELNKKGAITLIRSGSILLAIWGYRFFLFLRQPDETGIPFQAYLAPFYMIFGTIIMCSGLKVSRHLRQEAKQALDSESLRPNLAEEVIKK